MVSPYLRSLIVLLCVLCFASQVIITADADDFVLYGNEVSLANNIILTIDDVSIESNMRQMFDLLQAHGMTATLFPNTRYITQHDPELWRNMIAAGFEIGYHTRNHTSYMTPEALQADFAQFQTEVRTILNNPAYTIRYVRPPNGVWNADWLAWANANHLLTVRWNITMMTDDLAYIDGVLRNRESGGSIILLHTGEQDVQWLRKNLPRLAHLQYDDTHHYRITNLTTALND